MKELLTGFRGSVAHGTDISGSDCDTFSIVVMPKEYYLGLKNFESSHNNEDHLIHDVKKFFKLLIKSNPSALELLFTKHNSIDKSALELLENSEIFLSKKLVPPVLGHCSQLIQETDGKSLANLIRLLRMTEETLLLEGFNVYRKADAEYLRDIKLGKVSRYEVLAEADALIKEIKKLEVTSPLRNEPELAFAEKILVNILMENIIC